MGRAGVEGGVHHGLRLSPGISQAGKFGLIPTTITLGTGVAWLGVVSVANVGSLWLQTARAQTRLHAP